MNDTHAPKNIVGSCVQEHRHGVRSPCTSLSHATCPAIVFPLIIAIQASVAGHGPRSSRRICPTLCAIMYKVEAYQVKLYLVLLCSYKNLLDRKRTTEFQGSARVAHS